MAKYRDASTAARNKTFYVTMSIHSDLLNAFEQRNLGKFQEALEVFQADPNHYVKARDKTIFEIILSTPCSSAFIKLCVENGADFYMVNEPATADDSTFLFTSLFFCTISNTLVEKQQRTVSIALRHRVALSREFQASRKSSARCNYRFGNSAKALFALCQCHGGSRTKFASSARRRADE